MDQEGYIKNKADGQCNPVRGILKCPSETEMLKSGAPTTANSFLSTHYGINWYLGYDIGPSGASDNWQKWHPKTRLPNESKMLYFADVRIGQSTQVYDGLTDGKTRLRFRHNARTMNVLFVDGHAQTMNMRQVPNREILGFDTPDSWFWRRALLVGGQNYRDY